MAELTVDLAQARIPEAELDAHAGALRARLAELDAAPDGEFLRLPHRADLLRQIAAVKRGLPAGIRDVVQLGIGGSSLGGQVLCAALLPPRHNERVGAKGVRFHFPDNVDPETFGALLDSLDPRKTHVHVVSKTGGTIETAAQKHAVL